MGLPLICVAQLASYPYLFKHHVYFYPDRTFTHFWIEYQDVL